MLIAFELFEMLHLSTENVENFVSIEVSTIVNWNREIAMHRSGGLTTMPDQKVMQ